MASKRPPRLRALAGGRPAPGRTLLLQLPALQESVKALDGPPGTARAVSVATARELLTDQRVHLLRIIRKERPESVAALARLVGRTDESVRADLELLARAGVVTLDSPSAKSQVRAPRVAYERVEIRLDL
jgi:predicted transcriptional regulator